MKRAKILAAIAALSIVAAACGDDESSDTATTAAAAETTAAATETTEAAATDTTEAMSTDTTEAMTDTTAAGGDAVDLDTNGDGQVVFGVAAAGPRDDGAYYQAMVDKATAISEENGYAEPIVVDNITTEDAATELTNLAEQGVDVILVGASEIADPLTDLVAEYPDIFWYCNCGAGFPEDPGLAQSTDDGGEISLTAGYATGLKLQASGGDSVVFIGCCDLGFE